jgi:hypothetical protein
VPSIQVPSTSAEIASDAPARRHMRFWSFGGYVRNPLASYTRES